MFRVCSQGGMRFAADHLRAKALLALEEATQECRYGPVTRTFAIRFALAYLWSLASTDRRPFDAFWKALSEAHMWRFSAANQALLGIYQQLGIMRDDEIGMRLWKQCADRRKPGSDS